MEDPFSGSVSRVEPRGLGGRLDVAYKRKRVDRKDSMVFCWRTWSEVGR